MWLISFLAFFKFFKFQNFGMFGTNSWKFKTEVEAKEKKCKITIIWMEEDEGVCWATQAFPPSPPALPEPRDPTPAIAEEKERNLEINWTQHGDGSSSSSQWAELDVLLDSFTPQPASGTAAPTTTTTGGSSVDYAHLHAGLNAEQREAAEAPVERPLLICAGPGTGKTLTLCHRIGKCSLSALLIRAKAPVQHAYVRRRSRAVDLVARQNVRPEAILAITFSRKAADEMRHRLDSLCPLTRPVTVSNFHRSAAHLMLLSTQSIAFSQSHIRPA